MYNIGLLGFGVVGQGFYQIFNEKQPSDYRLARIAAKNPGKERNDLDAVLEFEAESIVNDPEINIVVEATNDESAAYKLVKRALLNEKHVISANKQLLAKNLEELSSIATKNRVSLLFEGAVGGVIPIIQNLKNYLQNDEVTELKAIINGSCNYILTQIFEKGKSYTEALEEAQVKGFAERDPSADVKGKDAAAKLSLLTSLISGSFLPTERIITAGIQNLNLLDIAFAKQLDLRIKQIASLQIDAGNIKAFVLPSFVSKESGLYAISDEYNAVSIISNYSSELTFTGKGAGKLPTGFAVFNDVLKINEPSIIRTKPGKRISNNDGDYTIYYRWTGLRPNFDALGLTVIDELDFSSVLCEVSAAVLRNLLLSPDTQNDFIAEASVLSENKALTKPKPALSIH